MQEATGEKAGMKTDKSDIGQSQPLVTVIMPAYNAEKYIAAAISSVLSQSYGELELLVIDDCSSDKSVEIAEGFERMDSRVKVLRNTQNMGVARTRNRGFDLARGEWIALIDSDDIWHVDKLEKQLERAKESKAKLLYTSYSLFVDGEKHKRRYIVPANTNYHSMLKENVIGCSTVMLHKTLTERFRFQYSVYHEDYALWLEILRNGYDAAGCCEILTDWRISKTSRSFDKWSAANHRWTIYRKVEKIPLTKAACVFVAYAFHGLLKHKRV